MGHGISEDALKEFAVDFSEDIRAASSGSGEIEELEMLNIVKEKLGECKTINDPQFFYWSLPYEKSRASLYGYDIDEFDFSSTKPLKYKFDDEEEVHVNNWSVLYQGFMDKLYNLNKDAFVSFMSDENYCGTTRSMLSKNADDLRYAGSISDGYYIEMNQNTMRKIKILRTLLIDMGYDNSTLVVYVVPA